MQKFELIYTERLLEYQLADAEMGEKNVEHIQFSNLAEYLTKWQIIGNGNN